MSEIADSSVRTEPLGEFCRVHAFYDCPVCRGEEPVWAIPIENPLGEVTGNIFVHESGTVTITGSPDLPEPPASVVVTLPPPRPPRTDVSETKRPKREPEAKVVPRLPRPTRAQIAAAAALFAEPDPEWVREAAARGRAVHDNAVALCEKEGISYPEAIERVLDESA